MMLIATTCNKLFLSQPAAQVNRISEWAPPPGEAHLGRGTIAYFAPWYISVSGLKAAHANQK